MFLLLLYLLLSPQMLLPSAASLSQEKRFEESETMLGVYGSLYKSQISEEDLYKFYFYKMINAHELNELDNSLKYADLLLSHDANFSNASPLPQRYKDLAIILKAEIEVIVASQQSGEGKDINDELEDISREMKKSRDRLAAGQPGQMTKTREIQDKIEARLKKLIDEEEAARAAQEQAAQRAAAEEAERLRKIVEGNSSMPAQDTNSGRHPASPGAIDKKKVKEIAEVWGKLPEKERARALVELQRNMPTADRHLVEKYFREMNRRSK